jgi:hypothetical protein
MQVNRRTILALSMAASLWAVGGAQAAPLKAPDEVKTALRLMMQVTNDFDRQITRKTYPRLPHENQEFQEATDALTKAVEAEPAGFKATVGKAVAKARAAAQKVSDESGAGQDAQLRADQGLLLKAVNEVFGNFPAELRPDPNVQPGGRPAPKG